MAWFTDLRKIALLACVTYVVSLIAPLWNSTRSIIASTSPLSGWRVVPLALSVSLITALLPIFYFALYRDEGSLHISAPLRLLARAAAFVIGILLAFQLVEWIKSPGAFLARSLVALATIANILLLAALFRHPGDASEEARPISTLLYVVTKVTVIVWSAWVAFHLLRVLLLPYTYSQLRDYALSIGREGPPLTGMIEEAVQAFLGQASLLTAPYVIYKSLLLETPQRTATL